MGEERIHGSDDRGAEQLPQRAAGRARGGSRLEFALLVALACTIVAALGYPLFFLGRGARARKAIAEYRAGPTEDADVIDLEDIIRPLGSSGVAALCDAVESAADVQMMKAFDGLDPRLTNRFMWRLSEHQDPDIRHGALLSLARTRQVPDEDWLRILDDGSEDRFVRQLAAHQLGSAAGWWRKVEPGETPHMPDGAAGRRVTFLRRSVSIADLCEELAWVTGGKSDYPPRAGRELLSNAWYFHVELEGMLADLRWLDAYNIYSWVTDDSGNVSVSRITDEK